MLNFDDKKLILSRLPLLNHARLYQIHRVHVPIFIVISRTASFRVWFEFNLSFFFFAGKLHLLMYAHLPCHIKRNTCPLTHSHVISINASFFGVWSKKYPFFLKFFWWAHLLIYARLPRQSDWGQVLILVEMKYQTLPFWGIKIQLVSIFLGVSLWWAHLLTYAHLPCRRDQGHIWILVHLSYYRLFWA